MKINLKKETIGSYKTIKAGFSWTTLLLGFFPALFRGDLKWAAIMFVINVITFGLAWIVFAFIYNGIYIKELINKGYEPADDFSKNILASKGFKMAA